MAIIRYRKIFFVFSGILVIASIISLGLWQLNFGIDFTGGSLLEVEIRGVEISAQQIKDGLSEMGLVNFSAQSTGSNGFILRFQEVDEETHQRILNEIQLMAEAGGIVSVNNGENGLGIEDRGLTVESLGSDKFDFAVEAETISETDLSLSGNGDNGEFEEFSGEEAEVVVVEKRFESIGPNIGKELKRKSFWAIILSLIAIIAYIAWVFRKVSRPVASWKYGIVAIVALFHDLLIVLGIFSVAGQFYGLEIGLPFVAAILTVLGYSVNDTIVVFDRIRENLIKGHFGDDSFDVVVNQSLNQTVTRSVNTSLTTLFVLMAIFIFGGESLKDFILALIFGIIFGTYSSIFIASPLLVEWDKVKK